MKRILIWIICTLTILVHSAPLVSAEFTDLSNAHPNYNAIIYLQDNEIIQGYSDGSFRPNLEINRVEFLKIIIEGSDMPLDVFTNSPFPDVDHDSWYGNYVRKAYAEGWIEGYPNGTFKPDQTINKVEALKILAMVQQWSTVSYITEQIYEDTPKTAWYTPYVKYAKDSNYLQESGPLYSPADPMTRANISEVIYRTIIEDTQYTPSPSPPPPVHDGETYDYFDDIALYETIPETFYQNEIYYLEGELSSSRYDEATVFIENINNPKDSRTFDRKTNNKHFIIPLFFPTTGTYYIGVIPGEAGYTTPYEITVVSELPSPSISQDPPEAPSNLNMDFVNNQTYLSLLSEKPTLKKITFSQNSNQVTYYSRQNTSSITVNYADFEDFSEGSVTVYAQAAYISSDKPLEISSQFSDKSSKSFSATKHHFSEIYTDLITNNIPETASSLSQISFSGTVFTDTRQEAYVIKPDGFVEELNLSTTSSTYDYYDSQIIPEGGSYTFTYSPSGYGTYIFEVNNIEGIPILNHPIYIGAKIPLLPDFFDLNERFLFDDNLSVSSLQSNLLNRINQSRSDHGLTQITLDNNLNELAQLHSEDMADHNYFSHVNLDNQTPDDRRLELGITYPAFENIAKDVGVDFAHEGLMRSASHRLNILETDWTKVGIGIALNDGYLYITEEFSAGTISAQDFEDMIQELVNAINTERSSLGANQLSQETTLENAAKYINDSLINDESVLENFNQQLLNEAISLYSISGSVLAIGRNFNIWSDIIDSVITEEQDIFESEWVTIGIDAQTDSNGKLQTIILLRQP